jgi:hypothetical protein
MKVIGTKMSELEEVLRSMIMRILIWVSSKGTEPMEKECTHGRMEKCMMENGVKVRGKDTEFGKGHNASHISESGFVLGQKGMESILGKMVTGMKDNGKIV